MEDDIKFLSYFDQENAQRGLNLLHGSVIFNGNKRYKFASVSLNVFPGTKAAS